MCLKEWTRRWCSPLLLRLLLLALLLGALLVLQLLGGSAAGGAAVHLALVADVIGHLQAGRRPRQLPAVGARAGHVGEQEGVRLVALLRATRQAHAGGM